MQDDLEPVRSCLGADQLGMTRAVLEAVASRAVASAADLKSFVCCTLLHHAGQVAARPAAVLCPALPRALAAGSGAVAHLAAVDPSYRPPTPLPWRTGGRERAGLVTERAAGRGRAVPRA